MKKLALSIGVVIFMINSFFNTLNSSELTWHASGNGGIVAAGPKPSVEAGLKMLKSGGNAVDAAVSVILNLAVSDYGSFCIGGEVPFMLYDTNTGKVRVFNGMGGAPGDAKAIDTFYSEGIPEEMSGIKVSTVPSALSTVMKALEINGTMSFEQVVQPTLELLDAGGESWYQNLATTFRKLIETEKSTKGTRAEKIKAARDRFYKGDIADELNKYYISSGAYLRKSDLEAHTTLVEDPVTVNYRGYEICKCNTWTQGPVLLQSLKLLESFDLKSLKFFSPDYIHVVVEAMKLAYADRDKYYGDPSFVKVPLRELLSDEYTRLRVPLIDMSKASDEIRPGDPFSMKPLCNNSYYFPGEKGTTTCVVVDKWGNAVAATPSSNGDYGICEPLGFAHNTRLTSFNTQKGHPNSIAPFKRPRITLTPTIVLKDGKPVIVISVAGGDMQDQVSLQLIIDNIDFEMKPKEAMNSPRFYTYHTGNSFDPSPDPVKRLYKIGALDIYPAEEKIMKDLERRKHIVSVVPGPIGAPVMVYIDRTSGIYYGATDPLYERDRPRGKYCGALDLGKGK